MTLSLVTLVIATTTFAQDAKLRRLDTGIDASAWEAVGRLDIGGEGFCTGALIAPDQVLTAAHCLFDKATGDAVDPTKIEFLAGWRNGRASAYRGVKRAAVHPDFGGRSDELTGDVSNDLAILELDHPIRNGRIKHFETGVRPEVGSSVGVVSYSKQRSEAPSLQEVCEVLNQREGVLVTSCTVDFGSSGAPIFVFDDGQAQIVSVVSAKAELAGENVSLGTSLDAPLAFLKAELASGRGGPGSAGTSVRRLSVTDEQPDTGAKFIQP